VNITLRLHDGFVSLERFDVVKVVERAGHRLLVGEIAGQLVEQILTFFDKASAGQPDKAEAFLERVASVVYNESLQVIDARDFTIIATDAILNDLQTLATPIEETPAEGQRHERLAVQVGRAGSTLKEIAALRGRTITDIEVSGDLIGLICDEASLSVQ
jgi:hypothetical protein